MKKRRFSIIIFFLLLSQLDAQSFYKVMGDPVMDEGGAAICGSPDGNLYVGGFVEDSAMVMKVSPTGTILWKHTFNPISTGPSMVNSLSITPDGFLIGTGHTLTSDFSDSFYFKMDFSGNLNWCKRETHPVRMYSVDIRAVSATEYYFSTVYYYSTGSWADPTLLRIDAITGNIISPTNRYDISPVPYLDDVLSSITLPSRSTFQIGRTYLNGSDPTKMRPFLIKYNAVQTPIWAKYYLYSNSADARIYGIDLLLENDSISNFYFGDRFGASANFTLGFYKTDTNGVVSWAKDYDIVASSTEIFYGAIKVPGGYILSGHTAIGGDNNLFLLHLGDFGNVIWARSFGSVGLDETGSNKGQPVCNHLGSIWFVGTENGTNSNLILCRADYSGDINCQAVTNLAVITTPFTPIQANLTISPVNDPIPYVNVALNNSGPLDDCSFSVDLGPDQSSCNPILLDPGLGGGVQYQWSDNSTSSTLLTSGPGTYWVQVTLNCCTSSDTIVIGGSLLNVDLGPDQAICNGSVILDAGNPGATYLWSDGTTGQTLNAGIGQFWVQVTLNGCISSDTLNITQGVVPDPDLGPDIDICAGESATLSAGNFSGQFLWSTNQTTQNIQVTSPGIYWVELTSSPGCIGRDSILVVVNPLPIVDLGADTTICIGQSITLYAGNPGSSYSWSNGENTQSISVQEMGTYTVTVTNSSNCSSEDEMYLTVDQDFSFELGPDIETCYHPREGWTIQSGLLGFNLQWSTGDQGANTRVFESQTVTLVASNECFSHSDSVYVKFNYSNLGPFMPNVFSPNGDGLNDVFPGPMVYEGDFYHLIVFDRWGKICFETESVNANWDGKIDQKEAAEGVYAYVVTVSNCDGIPGERAGTISLIR